MRYNYKQSLVNRKIVDVFKGVENVVISSF